METANTSPACFAKHKIELFVMNGEVVFCEDGKLHPFIDLPITSLEILREEMENDPRAMKGLEMLNISDPVEQLRQYAFCRYGDFDKAADLDDENENTISEYWNCGHRPCLADGYLCKPPSVPNGRLTLHEVDIIRGVGEDLPNKLIADRNRVSVNTVNMQMKTIAGKIGCFTKAGIARFAGQNNIF